MLLDSSELIKAADKLKSGDVVAIPTETVYGLAASIDSDDGLKKIFSTKERPFFDPLIVHVASFEQAKLVTREFPPLADFLARWFWPGPLTLVLPKAANVNPVITSGLDTVAVRFPAHPIAQEIIKLTGTPLAAPSANKFGRTSPSTAEHVRQEFGDELIIIDGGACQVGLESTVASVSASEIRILRPGDITKEDLESALERWSHPTLVTVTQATNSEQASESPGHLKHHYMPTIPLVIVSDLPTPKQLEAISKDLAVTLPQNAKELDLGEDAAQAARRLYSEMRSLSESGADLIYVVRSETRNGGLWAAVWDRLTRASSWTPEDRSRL